ncbi:hypothetical protein V490_02989 [Pseudogymnoascus sp. VKM F-3557]|nr:hypothetical protein V490_02989 [Pseudogymnoascus sp. VKM F-3557]
MGQESSQVQKIEEDPSNMDGNSSTRGGVEGDYPLPALPPPDRDARERTSSSPQLKRKMGNGISEDGAGDQSDSARRADKKHKRLLKKKSKDSMGGKGEGKSSEGTTSTKQKKKKNRSSDGLARLSSQSGPLQTLQNIGRSAAAVLLPRSDTVDRVPESSHPTVDAPTSSAAAKKRKRKAKAKGQSLQADTAGNGDNAGDGGSGPKAADAETLGKDKTPEVAAPSSSWAAVNVPPHAATPAKNTDNDVNTTNGQTKDKDADEEAAEEPAREDVLASINTIVGINKQTPRDSESRSPEKQTDANTAKPKSSQAHPVEDTTNFDPTQSQTTPPNPADDAMDLDLAEPQNKDTNRTDDVDATAQERPEVTNSEVPQIGVYAADDEQPPSKTRRPKRRLPVDDDPVETPSKKTKRVLKAKSPVTKGQKTTAAAKAPAGSSLPPQTPTRKAAANDGNQAGKMTDADLAVIKNQLLKYREMNDITEEQQNRLIHGKASEHAELFNMVCEEFPDRKRWAIIKFCRRKFHNFAARGKWTPEDDEELNEAYRLMPRKWTQIGQRLNRHPEDCRDRWRNYLVCGDNMITVYWKPDEEQKLRRVVAECVSHLQEMKDLGMLAATADQEGQSLVTLVDWQTVSEKMGRTRSRLQCRQKWKRMHGDADADADEVDATPHNARRSWREAAARKETQRMDLDDKLMLLRSIQESQVEREGKVQWKNLGSEEFRERFDFRAARLAFTKLKAVVPGPIPTDLQETVRILLEKLENANGQDPTEEAFRDPKTKKYLSKETIGSDDEDEDENIQSQIMQELPKLKNTPRSAEKKKLTDRMARKSESVDSVGNAHPSGGPEVPESDYDEPAAPKTNGKKTNGKHTASKSDSSSSSDSDSDLDEEIPARRSASISL